MSKFFEEILYEIQYSGYADLPRYLQIRVEKWISKLAQPITNKYWVRNRNEFAKVLLHCIVTRNFREPFDKLPPGGPLPALPSHLRLSKRHSPHHTKFWDKIHTRMGTATSGPANPRPRGTARWKVIAPSLFADEPRDNQDEAIIVDPGSPAVAQRRLQQLHAENEHLRKQVQYLARQRAKEATSQSTLINMVRKSPEKTTRSTIVSPHSRPVGSPTAGNQQTTLYVSNGTDLSGDNVSTTVLRKTSARPLGHSPRKSQNTFSPSLSKPPSFSSHSIDTRPNSSPLQTLRGASVYNVTPAAVTPIAPSHGGNTLNMELSPSFDSLGGSPRSAFADNPDLNRTLNSVRKQQVCHYKFCSKPCVSGAIADFYLDYRKNFGTRLRRAQLRS